MKIRAAVVREPNIMRQSITPFPLNTLMLHASMVSGSLAFSFRSSYLCLDRPLLPWPCSLGLPVGTSFSGH